MPPIQTNQRVHYPALDVLRGLAICFVVFYHNFHSVSLFRFGWMGVDLFFVLSGYLITDLLLESRENKNYFRNFYMRRVLRIFPLYYLVLVLFFTLSPYLFSQKDPGSTYSYYNDNKAWFWTYFQNWLMVTKGAPPVPFLAHFWSLAVEEQFYIFWPVLIFFFKKYGQLKKVIIGLIVVAIIIRLITWLQYPNEVEVFYCNTFTRMDSLLMGSLLAVHLKEGKKISLNFIRGSIACFVALVTASLLLFGNIKSDNALFPTIGYTISAIFFTSLLYVILKTEFHPLGRIRHLKILGYLGKISYGIYVFHIPIYLILSSQLTKVLATSFPPKMDEALMISGLSVILTIAFASLSYYFLETPILKLKKHFS